MFNNPESRPDFSKIDEQITKWWKDTKAFEQSLSLRDDGEEYVFYDGPPFMTGSPHYGTLLSSIAKDVVPRYQTMKGKHVERVWGWDCHGLPIEEKVEDQMGLSGRQEVEANLEEFIQNCYKWNRIGFENWKWYVDKIGRWVDLENAYRTLDQDYMESVWWVFKQIWDKGLVYKDRRTSLFSTDSSTPVSDFEVSMDPDNYKDTEDIAVYVKFELEDGAAAKLGIEAKKVYLVAWTTTPWTLPSNFALAVNPKAEYVFFEYQGHIVGVVKDRVSDLFGAADLTILAKHTGKNLKGLKYKQLFDHFGGGENDFQVYTSKHVTLEDGSGILHVAPAFGEADAEMGEEWGLSFDSSIDQAGNMLIEPWQGMYLRDANPKIADYLEEQGSLLKQEKYMHRLPYYRYDNPLIYKTEVNYFVNVQDLKPQLLESNQDINWVPEHFKNGRFKYILETAPDWCISRNRFWGTVMPIWESADGEQIVVGSRDELMQLVNNSKNDLTIRKFILQLDENGESTDIKALIENDEPEVTYSAPQSKLSEVRNKYFGETEQESQVKPLKPGESRSYYLISGNPMDMHRPYIDEVWLTKGGKEFHRVEETLDVWMDSGSMPFAQFHYPFENEEKFTEMFPGDFIAEYTGQVRAWFNVLHVIANAVFGKPAFKNVVVTGVLAGTDGRKMSKSLKNFPDPKQTLSNYGGDAFRLYLAGSPLLSGNDTSFNEDELQMQVREFLIPFWNIYKYLVTYANIHNWEPDKAYLNQSISQMLQDSESELDTWILTVLNEATAQVDGYLGSYELPKAVSTLLDLINETSKWYIRRSRGRFADGSAEALKTLYFILLKTAQLAAPVIPFTSEKIYRELTNGNKDLPESVHFTDYPEAKELQDKQKDILLQMQTVRGVAELGQSLRTTHGLKVRQPLAFIEVLCDMELTDWMVDLVKDELNVKEVRAVDELTKSKTILQADDPKLRIGVGLQTELTAELELEGLMRELIRTIQSLRKEQDFELGQKVAITYSATDSQLQQVLDDYSVEIMEAVSASSLEQGEADSSASINGKEIKLSLAKK